MKNHYLIKLKTGEVDENGFDNFNFIVTKRKFANAKDARKSLEFRIDGRTVRLWDDESIEDITPCSKDWVA